MVHRKKGSPRIVHGRIQTNAVSILKDDHRRLKQLFKEFEDSSKQRKLAIAIAAIKELEIHAAIEEEIFYPQVRRAVGDPMVMAEAMEEHHVIKFLTEELRDFEKETLEFDAKFKVLSENVIHHIKEEEHEMLTKASTIEKTVLSAIGEEMLTRRQELANSLEVP